ncbi:hypothetical protein JYT81_00155 [Gammaproteobacteria bacterium AH-315-K14]|nr:hypothetical protein [Gammaproteobacteria bacterium AH-315-K14]MBN4052979.1 hypothetical protein [Gammaproteobacteria bacterium AH-315-K14]
MLQRLPWVGLWGMAENLSQSRIWRFTFLIAKYLRKGVIFLPDGGYNGEHEGFIKQ